ncbi:succinate dehydrogenase/fumarate reductase iron-sulfur subunit [Trueperella bialowiezensis]|uniref:Succinate dehydrogenase iron-sulfur subunit n=1 Tax=Trueperella bialowiezensis TaxID=312285 RepID=A0A3S4VBG4_9ACTO|nr:succinate dehydrogenase/fumarate reductase iron-sulfur subunit [Trueperella bialowiezensis]VEI13813.1 Fumarate reductase iron-sulfur subunit [Trueperella bialowiezensis]
MKLNLEIWRQEGPEAKGRFEKHTVEGLDGSMSILEMLDRLNEELVNSGQEQVTFESDCREGICGACGIQVSDTPHGPARNTPACHQRLREFKDGQTVRIEPFRAGSYPVLRDLMVNRHALDQILEAGGHVAINAGTAPDADAVPVGHETVEDALDFAACIGCGACVAACPNGSAHLYLGAKLTHLAMLPLPSQERTQRAKAMVDVAEENFGPCSNYGECAAVCPANIPLSAVAAVNKERLRATFKRKLAK